MLDRNAKLTWLHRMRMHVIHSDCRLAPEPRRIGILNIVRPRVQQIQHAHLKARTRGELVPGFPAHEGSRACTNAVVLDQRIRPEVTKTQGTKHAVGRQTPCHATGDDGFECARDARLARRDANQLRRGNRHIRIERE